MGKALNWENYMFVCLFKLKYGDKEIVIYIRGFFFFVGAGVKTKRWYSQIQF
jgi:hypothetical protein